MKINSPVILPIPISASSPAATPRTVPANVTTPLIKASIVQLLTDWVMGAAPLSGADYDQFAWFLSKRANECINKWLASKHLAMLQPVSPSETGCILLPRGAVEHCRDHRAIEGVGEQAVVELLSQLFAYGTPTYAPNPSKGATGGGYYNQLAMFDANYKSIDSSAKGETPVGIIEHVAVPAFVHLKLITAYWTKPAKAVALGKNKLQK